jgi:hypothetical protein
MALVQMAERVSCRAGPLVVLRKFRSGRYGSSVFNTLPLEEFMKSLLSIALLSVAVTAAVAQTTPGLPPEQAPAGEPAKFKKPSDKSAAPAAPSTPTTSTAAPTDKKSMSPADRREARKEKREEKVGDKPLD